MKLNLIVFVTTLLFCFKSFCQEELTKSQIDSLPVTIENLFVKISGKSKKWNQYKMIDRNDFSSFQKEILDSVLVIKKTVITKQSTIEQLNSEITTLKTKIDTLNKELNKNEKLGSKQNQTQNLFIGLIALLASALFYFIYKFKNSNATTKAALKKFDDLEIEFEDHRKKALEKEQKLRRKLQDEINKQRGI